VALNSYCHCRVRRRSKVNRGPSYLSIGVVDTDLWLVLFWRDGYDQAGWLLALKTAVWLAAVWRWLLPLL
jgi:hypothetical protein